METRSLNFRVYSINDANAISNAIGSTRATKKVLKPKNILINIK